MSRSVLGLLVLAAIAGPGPAADDLPPVVLPGESRATALRLAEARKRIDEKKWAEAIDELQGLLEAGGRDLVPVDASRSVQARQLCHAAIAALPPEALKLYRSRVDGRAARWLEQGAGTRDPRWLRKVVDEAFCSRPAEKALDLLGDLAFERGRFDEAVYWWRMLVRTYPDPHGDRARLFAKEILARLFAGARYEAAADLEEFRKKYGAAEGTLAGRTGRYGDILEAVAKERQSEGRTDPDWATFGGDATRGLVVPGPADVLEHLAALCRDGPTWQYSLEDRTGPPGPLPFPTKPTTPTGVARTFAFHPVITSTHVHVADARHVTAHDLRSGASADWYDVARDNGGVNPNLRLPAPPDLRYTLTAAEGNVYARLGVQGLRPPAADPGPLKKPDDLESFLACLSLRPDAADSHFRWRLRAWSRDGALFEGSPLVDAGRLYVAATQFRANPPVTSIECYAADDPVEPPLRWHRPVCPPAREGKSGEPRYRHHLLTKAGPLIVFCSHAGAIVAVDADSGQPAWAVRYPRQADEGAERLTGLAPCLYADGRLYAAPNDSKHLLCLDAATGRTLWEREPMEVVHLLGVGQGRLIFTTPKGLRAVGAADGSDRGGWMQPQAGDAVRPMGRGLLIGDLVLWPTELGVYALRQEDGEVAGDPTLLHRLPAGNLACAHGCLAVADRFTLSVFVPPALRPREKPRQARTKPPSPKGAALERPPPPPRGDRPFLSPTASSGETAALPLRKAWHASLAAGEVVLPGVGSLVFSRSAEGGLTARRLATGDVAWRSRLPFLPAWVGTHGNLVVAGGDGGIVCLREEDGGPVWEFPDNLKPRGCNPWALTDLQLRAGRLFFFQESRRLFALDVETGRVLWSHWAPNARLRLPPPRGCFFPNFHASATRLLVQTATGRRWLLDAATGRLLDDSPTSSQPWPAPPRALDAHTLALVADSRRVLTLDAATGKDLWHLDLPGKTTLTGEPPQVLSHGDVLLLATPTNLGYRLDRLDRSSGQRSWARPCLLNLDRLDTTAWALDDEAVFLAHDHLLEARSLADGRLLWERPLSEASSWIVRRVGEGLLAYPDVAPRPYFRFPSLGVSVQWKRVKPPDAPAGFPVLCCDARTGRLVQRLNFPGFPRAQVRPDSPGSLVIVTSLASSSGAPPLALGPHGGFVALAGDVWGLASEGK